MTKRLAISMLLTVWAILIASGVTAYVTTRSVLVQNLDAALVVRAMRLNQSEGFVVKDAGGQIVDSSVKTGVAEVPRPELIQAKFVTGDDGTRVRAATVRVFRRNDSGNVVSEEVMQRESAEPLDRLLNRLSVALIVTGCVGGLIAAFVARAVAGIALRPLHSTAQTIGSIDEQNLARRIDSSKLAPELLPVADRLNEMLARLETSFANRKQFLADASHELRTPVAALVTTLEVSLRRVRDSESYRETMQTCLADARLLRKLVDALMQQARSEIAAFKEDSLQTDVSALLHECADILKAPAEQKGVTLSQAVEEPMILQVQPGRLKQAVMGLLENAIDHNRPGGAVELSAAIEKGQLRISVRDTGPESPRSICREFSSRFIGQVSHVTVLGHLGLGLYLVKSHALAMGGQCMVNSELGKGCTFQIVLPVRKVLEKPMETVVVS